MAQETTFDATDPTIVLSIRLRAWPSGQWVAVTVTAKRSHFCKCRKRIELPVCPLTPERAEA